MELLLIDDQAIIKKFCYPEIIASSLSLPTTDLPPHVFAGRDCLPVDEGARAAGVVAVSIRRTARCAVIPPPVGVVGRLRVVVLAGTASSAGQQHQPSHGPPHLLDTPLDAAFCLPVRTP